MTPPSKPWAYARQFSKTTALDGLDLASLWGQVLAVLGATANQ
jgi:hypothetical protein